MTKPKFIRADYNTTVEFDLKELEIDWDKVLDVQGSEKVSAYVEDLSTPDVW